MAILKTTDGYEAPLLDGANVMGCEAGVEIQVHPEMGLSARHLLIEKVGSEWFVEPLSNEAMTTVNGSPLQERRPLIGKAYLKAGELEFRFLTDVPTPQASMLPVAVPVGEGDTITYDTVRQRGGRQTTRRFLVAATLFLLLAAAALGGAIAYVSKG